MTRRLVGSVCLVGNSNEIILSRNRWNKREDEGGGRGGGKAQMRSFRGSFRRKETDLSHFFSGSVLFFLSPLLLHLVLNAELCSHKRGV